MKTPTFRLLSSALILGGCASAASVKEIKQGEAKAKPAQIETQLASALQIDGTRCDSIESTTGRNMCLGEVAEELNQKTKDLAQAFSSPDLKKGYQQLLKAMEKSCSADADWSAARFQGGSMAGPEFAANDLYCKRDFMVRLDQILKLPPLNASPEEFAKSEKELNQFYQKLLTRHEKEAWAPAQPKFIQAQRVWLEYRDQWGAFIKTLLKSQQTSSALWNKTNMTQSRAQRFQDEIEEFDSLFGL